MPEINLPAPSERPKPTKAERAAAKRRVFCAEYVISGNATQAAIAAGYTPRSAYSTGERLLRNAEVQAMIAAARAKQSVELNITKCEIAEDLQRIIDDPEAPVAARVRAIELKGKLIGAFTEVVDHTVTITQDLVESMQRVIDAEYDVVE